VLALSKLSERIKSERTKLGLTQEGLADLCKVTKSAVSLYESDKSIPNDEIKNIMADLFGVSMDYLMGRTDFRTPADRVSEAIAEDSELFEFWQELKDRPNLQLLFKQTRDMTDRDIMQIIKIIKAIEDEEDRENG